MFWANRWLIPGWPWPTEDPTCTYVEGSQGDWDWLSLMSPPQDGARPGPTKLRPVSQVTPCPEPDGPRPLASRELWPCTPCSQRQGTTLHMEVTLFITATGSGSSRRIPPTSRSESQPVWASQASSLWGNCTFSLATNNENKQRCILFGRYCRASSIVTRRVTSSSEPWWFTLRKVAASVQQWFCQDPALSFSQYNPGSCDFGLWKSLVGKIGMFEGLFIPEDTHVVIGIAKIHLCASG